MCWFAPIKNKYTEFIKGTGGNTMLVVKDFSKKGNFFFRPFHSVLMILFFIVSVTVVSATNLVDLDMTCGGRPTAPPGNGGMSVAMDRLVRAPVMPVSLLYRDAAWTPHRLSGVRLIL